MDTNIFSVNQQIDETKEMLLRHHFLICGRGDGQFGIPLSQIAHVIESHQLIFTQRSPICSIASWSGVLFPVLDFRKNLWTTDDCPTGDLLILLLRSGNAYVGLLIDQIHTIADLSGTQISPMDENIDPQASWAIGTVSYEEHELLLIDMSKLLPGAKVCHHMHMLI